MAYSVYCEIFSSSDSMLLWCLNSFMTLLVERTMEYGIYTAQSKSISINFIPYDFFTNEHAHFGSMLCVMSDI